MDLDPEAWNNRLQRRQIGSLKQKTEQTGAKIRRVHEGYESDPPVYTAKEAEERIKDFRALIARLGIMVYPSEDHKTVRITSKLPILGDRLSHYKISIASVMLSL